ncbi:helix-turn-helix transcriptional regulator [Clostridium perfringens]|uniref:Helix-turn-helix transcriptional regulator n=1 Tax=Clostridium perfringens TaxID=1502 RepID=A0AAN5SGD0_CLOPF|nr:helix-turn-helix transcriptional regulator [Clostridium perfringens]AQW26504.1 hypothetical protein BXT94_06890 [Clostridium perfringens]EHK2349263.1 helix-turn-helix transcriptional regulator [Clostridium perfringens]EHK2365691.1 helix-turn-helix transcriptional regulator [Clostridium perfringens]EHK2386669.1 helix-turn-helix transcriptional regulator [Clostridium perfringens]EIF6153741.1 helix-turn-helix transcriptional regulator [Clostridium perfringens]
MMLREIRKKSGIKANKIAEELGISRTQLYNLENGINRLSDDKIVKLSKIYNLPKAKIFSIVNGGK